MRNTSVSGYKKIAIAALDWGLGHATRCIPLIRSWISEGVEVVLVANGNVALLWQQHFPTLRLERGIPDYNIEFPESGSLDLHLMSQWFRIRKTIEAEHKWLQDWISAENIDLVVSDNRYGFYHEKIKSILITHQLNLPLPWPASAVANATLAKYVKPFQEVWVPDYDSENTLSGKLAHPSFHPNTHYIGPLSRFSEGIRTTERRGMLVLISGPEPERTRMQQAMLAWMKERQMQGTIVCGQPQFQLAFRENDIAIVPHLRDEALAQAIHEAEVIVCRSGYSTLMDLHVLNRKAYLWPTHGQREQLYLAQHWTVNLGMRLFDVNGKAEAFD